MSGRQAGFGRQVRTVWRKEMVDALRDRRSLMTALLYPVLMPLMITVMFGALARLESSERPLETPVVGREHAPNLVAWLEEQGVVVVDPPDDPDAAVRDGDVDLVLVIDEEYGEQFRSVQPAVVRIVHDSSRTASRTSIGRARNLLRAYSNQVALLRLMARGVSPGVMQAVRVDDLDLATPAQSAARFFSMLPMFLILASFIGGLNVAIDTTAGERERRSLEPLLVNPVSRAALTAGKWLTTSVFGLASAWLTLVTFLLMMRFVPLEQLGVQLSLGGPQLLLMAIAVAPIGALRIVVADVLRHLRPQLQGSADLREPARLRPDDPGHGHADLPAAGGPLDDAGTGPVAPAPADRHHGRRAGRGGGPGRIGRRYSLARLRVLQPDVPNAAPGENRLRARVGPAPSRLRGPPEGRARPAA